MTLTLSITLTCDLCHDTITFTPSLGHTASIAVVATKRNYPHSDIGPLKVDGLVDGGWVTRKRKGLMVDLCGGCAEKK